MSDKYHLKNEKRPLLDLYTVAEDDRIKVIGERASVGACDIILETDAIRSQRGKIARYIKKVTERYPNVRHISTTPIVEVANTALVKFGPKSNA